MRLGWLFLALAMMSSCTCGVLDAKARFTCASDTDCGAGFTCLDSADGKECIAVCSASAPCQSGRQCVESRCADVNECTSASACGASNECSNTPGSFDCRCASGFTGTTTHGGPAACVDVDECPGFECGPLGVCTNTLGSFQCGCAMGTFGATVMGGPTSCSTVDRCTVPGQCGPHATCQSTAESFSCTCDAGYSGTPSTGSAATCIDLDECATANVCGAGATCTNTSGSFSCACATGYTGSATSGTAAVCSDVNECPSAQCGINAHCTNTPGSYECACDVGFFGATMTGGPAVCSATNFCAGINCGADATCTSGASTWACTCNAGFSGATTMGGPATCVDTDECTAPNPCGANTTCANTPGSFTCTCLAGFTGMTTTGGPATCVSNVNVLSLGTAQGQGPLAFTLGQPVALDRGLMVVVTGTNTVTGVSDTRANVWTRVVNANSCANCGYVSLWTTRTKTALTPTDVVTVTSAGSLAIWVADPTPYLSLDTVSTSLQNGATATPSITTTQTVSAPDELVVGAFGTRTLSVLSIDGGYEQRLNVTDAGLSSVVASRVGAVSGQTTFSALASPAQRFSGFVATFYNSAQVNPTNLTLTHVANAQSFTVSWTGGRSNGGPSGCYVQVLANSTWTPVSVGNCDATSTLNATLPSSANWNGSSWAGLSVRLMRISDQVAVGTFPTAPTCIPKAASSIATPTIDENCDSVWDDRTCATYTWVMGTSTAAGTPCTNVAGTTNSKTCTAANDLEVRYTNGPTSPSPATVFSSPSAGVGCQGAFTGTIDWTCTGMTCTYR